MAGNLPVVDMIYQSKKMEAFYLTHWVREGGMLKTILRIRSCFKRTMPALSEGGWAESQFEDCRYHIIISIKNNSLMNIFRVIIGWRICGLR